MLTVGLVGLMEPTDDRFTGTIDAVRRELGHEGFISRYSTDVTDDGLAGTEGQFLACSFWLVEALAVNGRDAEARELFERLLACATTSACTPRSTTSSAAGRSATSRRLSATSRSSAPPGSSAASR